MSFRKKDLPWISVKLEQICSKPQYGYTTKASSTGEVKYLRTTDITKTSLNWGEVPYCEQAPEDVCKYQLKDRDIVISRAGSVGFSCLLKSPPSNAVFASYLIRFEPSLYVSESFLKRFLESREYWDQLATMSAGNAVQNVNAQKLSKLDLLLPPLAEQKVIAAKLDRLLAQVDSTKARLERIPVILKRFRQSVLAAAVSGRLTEEWREGLKKSGAWKQIELREAANIIDPHPSHRTPKAVEGGVPYIGIGDLRDDGSIDFENSRRVSFDVLKEHNERYTLKKGDFVFGKIGTLGKATVLPIGIDYTLSANVILIQPLDRLAVPEYLQYFLSSPSTMDEIAKLANSTSQAAFGIKKMRSFQCSLPSKQEQTEIVRRVEELFTFTDSIEAKAQAALERVSNLTQSILAKAFRGDLTAAWRAANPDLISGDNSAAALLAKIKAERAAIQKQAKPKRVSAKRKAGKSMSKQIVKVVEALKKAGEPLSGQQLLAAAGYPGDSGTEELEKFFLDIREALMVEKSIVKLERSQDGQDWFTLAEVASK